MTQHETGIFVNIHVEYEANVLVAMGLAADPACDGVILKLGAPDEVLASTNRGNPLDGTWLADLTCPGNLIVSWSGTLAATLFESHPMTWLRSGREAFARFLGEIAPQLESSGKRLCFQPHCRHVLCDPQSCVVLGREQEGPIGFALSPADMLEPVMIPDLEDHLTRAFEMLGEQCDMVILNDVIVREGDSEDGGSCESVPLGQGVMPREHVLQLIDACVPSETPIVVSARRIEDQLQWLGA